MSVQVTPETPCYIVKQLGYSTEFVDLTFKHSNSTYLSRDYLLHNASRDKSARFDARLDCYIRDMRQFERMIQYYISVDSERSITYLAAKYFTLGLLQVEKKTVHIIKNETKAAPLYLFKCLHSHKENYGSHVNLNKAIINRNWIIAHFEPVKIEPDESYILGPQAIYFFYSVSHCMFSLERMDKDKVAKEQMNFASSFPGASTNLRITTDAGDAYQKSPGPQNSSCENATSLIKRIVELENKIENLEEKNQILQEDCARLNRCNAYLQRQNEELQNIVDSSKQRTAVFKRAKIENVKDKES